MNKPKIGQPCNGCGKCCRIQVCRNGAYALRLVRNIGDTVEGPCPAMIENEDGSVSCGIVINPKKYIKGNKYPADVLSRNFAKLIGAEMGCDELCDEEDEEEERKLDEMEQKLSTDEEFIRKVKVALKVVHGIK